MVGAGKRRSAGGDGQAPDRIGREGDGLSGPCGQGGAPAGGTRRQQLRQGRGCPSLRPGPSRCGNRSSARCATCAAAIPPGRPGEAQSLPTYQSPAPGRGIGHLGARRQGPLRQWVDGDLPRVGRPAAGALPAIARRHPGGQTGRGGDLGPGQGRKPESDGHEEGSPEYRGDHQPPHALLPWAAPPRQGQRGASISGARGGMRLQYPARLGIGRICGLAATIHRAGKTASPGSRRRKTAAYQGLVVVVGAPAVRRWSRACAPRQSAAAVPSARSPPRWPNTRRTTTLVPPSGRLPPGSRGGPGLAGPGGSWMTGVRSRGTRGHEAGWRSVRGWRWSAWVASALRRGARRIAGTTAMARRTETEPPGRSQGVPAPAGEVRRRRGAVAAGVIGTPRRSGSPGRSERRSPCRWRHTPPSGDAGANLGRGCGRPGSWSRRAGGLGGTGASCRVGARRGRSGPSCQPAPRALCWACGTVQRFAWMRRGVPCRPWKTPVR